MQLPMIGINGQKKNFDPCSTITRIYKIGSEILGPSPDKFGGPKHQNLGQISSNFAA